MTIHWFFSLGVNPQPAVYYRSGGAAPSSERRFVTTALLDLEWPVTRAEHGEIELHLLPTKELDHAGREQRCRLCEGQLRPPAPSPRELFVQELDVVAPGLSARIKMHDEFEKRDDEAIWEVVRYVLDSVRDGDEVVLETTNGIRSIVNGFLLASGLLIAQRRRVKVRAVTYAEFAAERLPEGIVSTDITHGSPVVDMLPFLQLFEWSHAVRAMSEYLDPNPTAALLRSDLPHFAGNDGALRGLGAALALNFPVEIERSLRAWSELGALHGMTPAAELAMGHISRELETLFHQFAPQNGGSVLDERRLQFDLALIERLVKAQRFADAARALREWIVNAVLVAWNLGEDWLKQSVRARAERALGGIPDAANASVLELRGLWKRASAIRNAVSHLKYNDKHEVDVATLDKALSEAIAGIKQLRASEANPFALDKERVEIKHYLANAFTLNMLARSEGGVSFKTLSLKDAKSNAAGRVSIVGHADAAALFSKQLGREVRCQRETVALDQGDTVLVGQYVGDRLPEGTNELPQGAKIRWMLVEVY